MKKFKCFSWKNAAIFLNVILCVYSIFSFVMVAWYYTITDWENIFKMEGEDFIYKHSCIAVIIVDIFLFFWSIFGVISCFQKRQTKTTIYAVFLLVLLFYKLLYGSIFMSGGSSLGHNYHIVMLRKWDHCCEENESFTDLAVWKISNANELASIITMFIIGNFASFSLYHVSIS